MGELSKPREVKVFESLKGFDTPMSANAYEGWVRSLRASLFLTLVRSSAIGLRFTEWLMVWVLMNGSVVIKSGQGESEKFEVYSPISFKAALWAAIRRSCAFN